MVVGLGVGAVRGRRVGETVYPDSVKSCSQVAALLALAVPSSVGAKVVLNQETAQQLLLCVLVKELFQTVVVNSENLKRGEEEGVLSLRCFCS